jgi:hypothetical protein
MPGHVAITRIYFSRGAARFGISISSCGRGAVWYCRACLYVACLSSQLSRHAETRHGGQQHNSGETSAWAV